MFAKGSLLAQFRPSASASTAYTSTLRTEITQIVVCNTTGVATTYGIYHDDDGATFDATTALFHDAPIAANSTVMVVSDAVGSGFMMGRGASIGVDVGTDQAVTFSIYGVTEDVSSR